MKSASCPTQSRLLDNGGRLHAGAGGMEVMAPAGQQQQETDKLGFLSPFSPVFDLELEKKANSGNLERCCSEHTLAAADAAAKPTLFQQILQLCRCTSPVAAQLLQQVQRLRIAFAAAPKAAGSPPAANTATSPTTEAASTGSAAGAQAGFLAAESSMDIEAIACELLASGYLVQVRDGAQQHDRAKTTRSCLQNLRHRFVVCLGWRSSAEAEAEYLAEPLVVEPRFREQFAIAHPTAEYEALLQAVPACFVGSVANLESIVKLLCEQMVAAFKIQGLPVPPWRTRQALLSKWSPTQLAELAAKIANVRRLSVDMAAYGSTAVGAAPHAHDRLRNGDRPAAAHAPRAAVGSAPPEAGEGEAGQQQVQAFAAAAAAAGGPQQMSQAQLMAILPPEMQQQLFQQAAGPRHGLSHLAPASAHAAAAPGLVTQQQQQQQLAPVISSALPLGGVHREHACMYYSDSAAVPISAVAGPLAPILQGVPAEQHQLGVPAHPMGKLHGAASIAASAHPAGISPAAADVIALLEAAEGFNNGAGGSSTLKFTRKASAEWKNQRSAGRKMKGLLAAALKKPVGGSSRSNLGMALPAAPSPASVADALQPLAALPGSGAGGQQQQQQQQAAQRDSGSGPDALIRRTHYRTTGDEPWRRITTVRWGAYAAQPAPQQQQPAAPSAMATH